MSGQTPSVNTRPVSFLLARKHPATGRQICGYRAQWLKYLRGDWTRAEGPWERKSANDAAEQCSHPHPPRGLQTISFSALLFQRPGVLCSAAWFIARRNISHIGLHTAAAKIGEMCPESSLRLAEALVLSRVPTRREEALGFLPGVDRSLQKRICLYFFPSSLPKGSTRKM